MNGKPRSMFSFIVKVHVNPETGEPSRDKDGKLMGRVIPHATIEGLDVSADNCQWFNHGDIDAAVEDVLIRSGMLEPEVKARRVKLMASRRLERTRIKLQKAIAELDQLKAAEAEVA